MAPNGIGCFRRGRRDSDAGIDGWKWGDRRSWGAAPGALGNTVKLEQFISIARTGDLITIQ